MFLKFSSPVFYGLGTLFALLLGFLWIQPVKSNWVEKELNRIYDKAVRELPNHKPDSLNFPRTLNVDGSLMNTHSGSWTSGFYPGILWQLHDYKNNNKLKEAAEGWGKYLEKEKLDKKTHDLGFKVYCSFGNGYEATKNENYKAIILQAAKTLSSRYNPKVGLIRSWDHHKDVWDFPVIIDNLMNLEMLFRATTWTGDSSYYKIAYSHAFLTMKNHYRPDISCFHVVDYNPNTGAIQKKVTHQGASDASAWARGQAWGLYGYTMIYRETKDPQFLQFAHKIADYIFSHPNMPADLIPYWDFNAPNIPNEERDVSAATILASGLLELAELDKSKAKRYRSYADKILENLQNENYRTNKSPFFLQHSVGGKPNKVEIDVPIVYADYYYVEALKRKLSYKR